MKNFKKTLAVFLTAVLFLTVVLSAVLIVFESDHNCIGSECLICQCIVSVRENIKSFVCFVTVFLIVLALIQGAVRYLLFIKKRYVKNTLIALKTELLN